MLNVERRNLGTVSLLNLDGNVVIGETGPLHDLVQTLPPASSVVMDLSRVRMVDAHGLGVLLQLREQSQARGMQLELTNISNQLRELFRITRLDSVFQIRSGVGYLPLPARQRLTLVAA
jgi:anti-anti-sigma factor